MIKDNSDGESWATWKRANTKKLEHPAGYEEKFVDLVLSQVPSIQPDDVIAQYPFVDSKGRNRRIDFVIQNDKKGWLLPIELDGNKRALYPEKWTDSLDRQNDLLRIFGSLLRYSNEKMRSNSKAIIEEIGQELLIQTANKRSRERRDKVLQNIGNDAAPAMQPAPSGNRGISRKATVLLGIAVLVAGLAVWAINQHRTLSVVLRPSLAAIAPSQAGAYVGERKLVCGTLASSSEIPSGRFLNFDRPYPNQAMTVVLWRRDYDAVGKLDVSNGDNLCVEGVIQLYDGKPRIQLSEQGQIIR